MILQVESEKPFGICSKCGTKSHRLHQNHRHIIKDLPLGEKEVFLEINRRGVLQYARTNVKNVKNHLAKS
jgi:transposase